MDVLLALTGKDFCLLGSDTSSFRSIVRLKSDTSKTLHLSPHTALLYSGEPGDSVQFTEYIQRNIKLHNIRYQKELTPHAIANFTRKELATALRSRSPFSTNLLIGGYNCKTNEPELYWMDYLSALARVEYTCHGYASYFCNATMDDLWRRGMELEEGKEVMRKCVGELKTRFLGNLPGFEFWVVDKDGIREVEL